jgi:hypothetical protein
MPSRVGASHCSGRSEAKVLQHLIEKTLSTLSRPLVVVVLADRAEGFHSLTPSRISAPHCSHRSEAKVLQHLIIKDALLPRVSIKATKEEVINVFLLVLEKKNVGFPTDVSYMSSLRWDCPNTELSGYC